MSTTSASKKKTSSVRHTRAVQRDRRTHPPAPPDAQVEARLTELIHPATFAQLAAYRALGLRERILTLPVMVAFVLSLIWRQMGSVCEAVRVLRQEGFLWVEPQVVSQQAVSQRLSRLPPRLFAQVLEEVLPVMHQRQQARQRPLPPVLAWARQHFTAVLAVDGSTLDALLRKVGLLREAPGSVLAGRMAALLEVGTHLPHAVWYEEDSVANDARFWERILAAVQPGTLLLCDLGFRHYAHFATLHARGIEVVTRVAANAALRPERTLVARPTVRDQVVTVGVGKARCATPMRLVEWWHQGQWYRYLTTILDPGVLPTEYVVALYWQRWRIEEAFLVVKRLLGLAYFYVGSVNGVQVQVWATWLLYAVLVDLTDAVAEALAQPCAALSLEMVYRALYHFAQAHQRGQADDPITYLAAKAKELSLLKRSRPHKQSLSNLVHLTSPPAP